LRVGAYQLSSESLDAGVWSVTIRSRVGPEIVDLRTLPAPLPLERVLESTAALEPGEAYLARVPRYPRLLLPHLRERGLEWLVHEEPDGSALLRIERAR